MSFVMVAMLGMAWLPSLPKAAEKPLFQVGHTYAFIWDCAPTYLAQAVSVSMAGGEALSPCYGERLKVRARRKDGWLEVQDLSDNSVWMVNPSRATAIREHTPELQASR